MLVIRPVVELGFGFKHMQTTTAQGFWSTGALAVAVALVSEMKACAGFPLNKGLGHWDSVQ